MFLRQLLLLIADIHAYHIRIKTNGISTIALNPKMTAPIRLLLLMVKLMRKTFTCNKRFCQFYFMLNEFKYDTNANSTILL
jgi:hypothetical protein